MLDSAYSEALLQKYTHLPWITFPAIEYLAQLDLREKALFEWGSGESTLFFAERCKSVISVDHDPHYYALYKDRAPNAEVYLRDISNFAEVIDDFNTIFDVIAIDSERRADCCKKALKHLSSGGLIIFDNSNWHGACCKLMRDAGLIQVDFHGMGAHNDYAWTTSLFFTRDFNFKPLLEPQPQAPLFGGLVVVDE